MQTVYAILCALGAVLPYSQFAPFLAEHGLNVPLIVGNAFATPLSGFAWWDVIVSALALLAFVFAEGRRLGIKRLWLPVAALVVGVSLALPLFLWLRERHLSASS